MSSPENPGRFKVVAELTLDVDILNEVNANNGERTGSP